MKTKLIAFLILCLTVTSIWAQPINTEVFVEGKSPVLLGKINKEGLSANSYAEWFTKNYYDYATKQNPIDSLKTQLYKYTITAFMGTWCGDSKREIPRFYKVLEDAEFPLGRLTIVALSGDRENYKQSPGGEEEGLNIHRVPTFIIYKNGKEVNRIVESPVLSLEEDLLGIIQKNYTPNYNGVTLVNDLLTETDERTFHKKHKRLIPTLLEEVKSMYELNTYSNVLFYAHKKEEAVIAARLNTLLFPQEAKTFSSLADKLYRMDNPAEAIENYEKALALDPENTQAKNGLAMVKGKKTN